MHDDPVDSEPLMQTLEVNKLKIVPTLERFDLFLPSAGKCREHADGTAVFDGIGEPGALGNGTKSVLVFAGQSHKVTGDPWCNVLGRFRDDYCRYRYDLVPDGSKTCADPGVHIVP